MEQRTVVFDTETNGMRPKGRNIPLSSEPALVQIAAVQYLGWRPVAHISFFMHPLDGVGGSATIPKEPFFINSGITQETVDAVGVPYHVGLSAFDNMIANSDRAAAHNIAFDDPIIRAAFERAGMTSKAYAKIPKLCTMKTLEPILKLPGKYGYKFPSLDESYKAMVDEKGFTGAHDAMVDVEACARVLRATEEAGYEIWKLQGED